MTVEEALAAAEQLLPGQAAPEGEEDPRWQAVIKVGYFVEEEPEAIWPFVLKWGSHPDEDVRSAIATCLLEDLLEFHFDLLFQRVEAAARSSVWFAKTTAQCWKLGQAKEPANAKKFDRLCCELRALGRSDSRIICGKHHNWRFSPVLDFLGTEKRSKLCHFNFL